MASSRDSVRREGDGRGGEQDMPPEVQGHVPPQVQAHGHPQIPNDPLVGNTMLEKFRASMNLLAQTLTI